MRTPHPLSRFLAARLLPLLACAFAAAGAMAQTQADPPARVGTLTDIQGSVAFAPPGQTEWTDAQRNRPITGGDRLWTDRGSRAELHLGSDVLHVDGQTFLDVTHLDDGAFQASLNEGTLNARVREVGAGENFEIDTPQLALRASQPGDFRVDVDKASGTTSVTIHSGAAIVYGARGESQQLQAGQRFAFTGRDLHQAAPPALRDEGFDRWAADRNGQEDRSVAARYVPREVVGYQELDRHGDWAQDATYGAVWFPQVAVADWAPYRYGHWEWIVPWGWTWIDDAAWGFAPFHYGRWTMIGARWCWVPGRFEGRPFYSPALVAFIGGNGFSLTVSSGPGVAWFPLAPGEAWRPWFRASTAYVRNVNRNYAANSSQAGFFFHQRPAAITSMRTEDFTRGRPVHQNWRPVSGAQIARAPVGMNPVLPQRAPRQFAETTRPAHTRVAPPGLERTPGERGRSPARTEERVQNIQRPEARPQAQAQRQQMVEQRRQQQQEQQSQRAQAAQEHVARQQDIQQQRAAAQQRATQVQGGPPQWHRGQEPQQRGQGAERRQQAHNARDQDDEGRGQGHGRGGRQ